MFEEIPKISAIIRDARKDQKMSQDALAKKAGITKRTISAIETEEWHPAFDVFYKLVRILNISTEHIFWPEKAPCTPEQEQLFQALQFCTEKEQSIFMGIGWAYIRGIQNDRAVK